MAGTSIVLATATLFLSYARADLSATGFVNRDPLCPYPSQDTTYYPNPENCAEFFECYEGRKYVLKCNAYLYWSQTKLQCDYPQNVNCSREDVLCSTKSDGTYIANPAFCSTFYECVHHKALGRICTSGLLWNKETQKCDYPRNVKC